MMSLKFRCIAVLACLILHCYVLSLSALLNIKRGDDGDIFDNPNCDNSTGVKCSCKVFINTECEDSTCKRCRCSSKYTTLLSSNDNKGLCVKDRRLLFIPTSTNSFLVEQNKRCMRSSHTYVTGKACNVSDSRQHWIWTRNNQLVHIATLKCLQLDEQLENASYWKIILQTCNSAEVRQLWKCHRKEGQTFSSIETSNSQVIILYMRVNGHVLGTTFLILKETKWNRYGSSGETLCSKAFGCEGFIDSAILLTGTRNCTQQCLIEMEIDVPHKSGKNLCFVMWEESQYLDKDEWKQLVFRDQIFTIEKRNTNKTFLQLDYAKATSNWSGLIVKLHFYCASRKLSQVNTTEMKCVVIKFKGTIEQRETDPTSASPTVSTTMTNVFTNFTTGAAEKSQSGSSIVLVIVVCVVVAILILCGILGFIFYKRRRRSAENKEIGLPASRRSGDTTNPIYTPANDQDMYQDPDSGASRQCELYESSENNVYEYADVEKKGKQPPPQEHQYDYAKNDNIRPVPQERLLPGDQSHNHPRNADVTSKGKASNGEEEQGDSQTPAYQILEAP